MSTLSKNKRKDELLTITAKSLFWKYGIKKVNIEEICIEAGVSKMTFYRYFKNKTELIKKVIENLFNGILNDYQHIMNKDVPFEEKVREQLIMKFEGTNDISPELIKDIYGEPESEICQYWKSHADEMMKQVIDDYKKAQEEGWIRKDIKLEFILYMSNKTMELASDESLQAMYPNMQAMIMEIANFFFYGILPYSKK